MKKKYQDGTPLDSIESALDLSIPDSPDFLDTLGEEAPEWNEVPSDPLASQEESEAFVGNIGALSEGVAATVGGADVDMVSAPGDFGASKYDRFASTQDEMNDLGEIRGRNQGFWDVVKNGAVNLAGGVTFQIGGNIAGVARGLYDGVEERCSYKSIHKQ